MNVIADTGTKRAHTVARDITIGIPRAMIYHQHGRLWENFFTLLGCNLIVSQETNRRILDLGVSHCSTETCLPVKILAGHALSLAGKADFIFIPRYISTGRFEFCCPKLCGLPDMIRLNLKNKIDVMEIALDLDKGMGRTNGTLRSVAEKLDIDEGAVRNAFLRAVKNNLRPDMEAALPDEAGRTAIAVLGHHYMIYDNYLSMNLIRKLRDAGYRVLTPASLDCGVKKQNAYPYYESRYFYGIGSENLGSAFTFARDKNIGGIIYLTPFACGIDSLVTEFIERHLKAEENSPPFMKITVDEHTGEAGFDTRLEAFLDMIGGRAPLKGC